MFDAISNTIGEWTGLINGVSHVFMLKGLWNIKAICDFDASVQLLV